LIKRTITKPKKGVGYAKSAHKKNDHQTEELEVLEKRIYNVEKIYES
jgi:hypothetical protein